jgi:hypothetical protein
MANTNIMANIQKFIKVLVLVVWGSAIALRFSDIAATRADARDTFALGRISYAVSPIRVDTLDILMSIAVIVATFLLIGRIRNAWLVLSGLIIASKIATVVADARVGDLSAGDLAAISLATFVLPAFVLILLFLWRNQLGDRPSRGTAGTNPRLSAKPAR